MENFIDASWIQYGEIGALFVVILAGVIFINKVLNIVNDLLDNAQVREEKVMSFVFDIQPSVENILTTQEAIVKEVAVISERVGEVEDVLKIDRRRKRGNGWGNHD